MNRRYFGRWFFAVGCFLSQYSQAIVVREVEVPGAESIVLRAEINYGTSNSCQARQIPHLVEHLVLADTTGGKTLTDLLSNLGHHGISLDAVTLQDNTAFTITGPKSEAARIVRTLIETIGRKNLPASALEPEKKAITIELKEVPGFISMPSTFELFSHDHLPGSPVACGPDTDSMQSLTLEQLEQRFDEAYVGANITLISVGAPLGDLLQEAATAILSNRGEGQPAALQYVTTVSSIAPVEVIDKVGPGEMGYFEIRIGIPGRTWLNNSTAKAFAEVLRLDAQLVLRNDSDVYYVSSRVHQSNATGWISLATKLSPSESRRMAGPVAATVKASIETLIKTGIPSPGAVQSLESIAEDTQSLIASQRQQARPSAEALEYARDKVQVRYLESRSFLEEILKNVRSRKTALLIFLAAFGLCLVFLHKGDRPRKTV